jgi:RNA ligase (TIGR02306 family)
MSTLKVEVIRIDKIKEHSNADALDIAIVKGWQVVIRKGEFKSGDLAVYFPLDSVLSKELSDTIGVTKYLSNGRVRAAKLRHEPSYGLLWNVCKAADYIYPPPFDTRNFSEGVDLTEALGVTKWEPPINLNVQDAEIPHPLFEKYTNIENMRNYLNIIQNGELVVITEKIHGSNCRFALINGEFMVGSHNMRFKPTIDNKHSGQFTNKYWHVFSEEAKNLIAYLSNKNQNAPVIIFGELYGHKVQDLHYGFTNRQISFRCFDIWVNGKYIDYDQFTTVCAKFNVPTVPVLYKGEFSMKEVLKFSTSKTFAGGDNIMEGVVVKPYYERFNEKIGRVILKYVFDQYLTRKGGTEDH